MTLIGTELGPTDDVLDFLLSGPTPEEVIALFTEEDLVTYEGHGQNIFPVQIYLPMIKAQP